jgi:hypothetical protein
MAQWGRNDQAVTANSVTTAESSNGAPIGTHALVKSGGEVASVRVDGANAHFGNTSAGSRANVDVAMFGNTTLNAFIPGTAKGVFGLDATEMGITTGSTNGIYRITAAGSGYASNTAAAVTMTFANATTSTTAANATVVLGRVTALTSNDSVTGISEVPALAIAAPAAINITANSTGFSNTTDTLVVATANSKWQVGDRLYYSVPTANTPIAPLTGNSYYYVSFTNSSTIALSLTSGGANIDIVDTRVTVSAETHTIRGDTATGLLIPTGAKRQGAAHAGWVLRTEGTGGRAGRVHYETLVAMGSLGAQTAAYGTPATTADGTDDTLFHDS